MAGMLKPVYMNKMGIESAFSPTTIFFIISTIFLLNLIRVNKRSKDKNLPPGPWKLPIIGSMHHLASKSLPHHTLTKLSKRHGPLMHLQLGEITNVVVSSPQMAKLFMKTHDHNFGGRPSTMATDILFYNKAEILFSPCNDHWRQMRKICVVELLSNKRVKSFSSVREDEVLNLVSFIKRSAGLPFDLSAQIINLTNSVICRAAFGEKFSDQSSLISLTFEASSLAGAFNLGDFFPSVSLLSIFSGTKKKIQKIHKKIDLMLDDIIQKRRKYHEVAKERGEGITVKEDLLDVLLRLHHENKQEFSLTDNNIKAVILDMFGAGTESSASVIEWAMCEMIKNPRVMEKAQSELRHILNGTKILKEDNIRGLHYLNLVIKETLRFHPPGPLLAPRECTEACEINGYTIPVKTVVHVNLWAIGRDPDFWEDAEKFIPERFEKNMFEYNENNFEYIPFGAGRRTCPGNSFGLAVVELVLAQLLYHFNWKLPDRIKPEELDMTETFGLVTKRRIPLSLIAVFNETTLVQS